MKGRGGLGRYELDRYGLSDRGLVQRGSRALKLTFCARIEFSSSAKFALKAAGRALRTRSCKTHTHSGARCRLGCENESRAITLGSSSLRSEKPVDLSPLSIDAGRSLVPSVKESGSRILSVSVCRIRPGMGFSGLELACATATAMGGPVQNSTAQRGGVALVLDCVPKHALIGVLLSAGPRATRPGDSCNPC